MHRLPLVHRSLLAASLLLVGSLAGGSARADELVVDNTDTSVQARGKWMATTTTPEALSDSMMPWLLPG